MDKQILEALNKIQSTLNEHTQILDSHTQTLDGHTQKLDAHTKILDGHTQKLDAHTKILDGHTQKLDEHDKKFALQNETLKEHGRFLSALRTGQEETKAQLDSMKIENAKEFGEMKEQIKNVEAGMGVLKDETWSNKRDIYRVKNTMGLN